MSTIFIIDNDNALTAYASAKNAPKDKDLIRFTSEEELETAAQPLPADRLVTVWNGIAGVVPFDDLRPVKKFTNRKIAVTRLWTAAQRLLATVAAPEPDVAKKPKRSSKSAKSAQKPATAREGSKKSIVLGLLQRANGATLGEIMEATGWQAHSVRGFLSGAVGKKMGLTVASAKNDAGERVYQLAKK